MTLTTTTTKEEQREALLESLSEKVEALRTSAGWQNWLQVASKLGHYSLNNQMLIAIQNPDATHVTSYGKKDGSTGWLALGRQVRKGEQALRIFAPMKRKVPVDARGVQCEKKDAVDRADRLVGFRLVPVFDVSQTDGDPLPESPGEAWRRALGTDDEGQPEHYAKVKAAADALGFPIIEEVDPKHRDAEHRDSVEGWFVPGSHNIHVMTDTPGRMAKTALHELGHALDDEYDRAEYDRGELVAESVSFLLANELGLSADGVATTYLAGWKGDTDKLTALANRVLKITRKVSEKLFPEQEEVAA